MQECFCVGWDWYFRSTSFFCVTFHCSCKLPLGCVMSIYLFSLCISGCHFCPDPLKNEMGNKTPSTPNRKKQCSTLKWKKIWISQQKSHQSSKLQLLESRFVYLLKMIVWAQEALHSSALTLQVHSWGTKQEHPWRPEACSRPLGVGQGTGSLAEECDGGLAPCWLPQKPVTTPLSHACSQLG